MQRELPHLEFLPINTLIIHEWHDNQRTPPLIKRIVESGIWRNPPIVAPLPDASGRYMVLDGANRFTAAHRMGLPDILVQVVPADSPGLRLHNWNHVVWGLDSAVLMQTLEQIPDTELAPSSPLVEPDLWGSCGLAQVHLPNGEMSALCTDAVELVRRTEMLNQLVNAYKDRAHLDRTSVRDIHQLKGDYPDLCGLVVFPNFKVSEVMALAGQGYLLPAGITRFMVAPRALHLNYPLSELQSDKALVEKNLELRRWLQGRIASKGIRYYAEPTFLFDE